MNLKILKAFKRIINKIEDVKIELTKQENSSFFIDSLYNDEDFKINIERSKYEELCIDLWKQYFIEIDKALNIAKLNKNDIDDIILVGGSVRTPKIKQMIEEYFQKKPLQNINVDEVVAYGASIFPYLDIKIHDITTKNIGISTSNGKMSIIIPAGTVLPVKDKSLKFYKEYILEGNNILKTQTIKIYEGNNSMVSDNHLIGKFIINVNKNNKGTKIKIIMYLDHNSILHVYGKINDEKNTETELKMEFDEL